MRKITKNILYKVITGGIVLIANVISIIERRGNE